MRIGFTGSRDGMTESQMLKLRSEFESRKPSEFHHGDCLGADSDAHVIARLFSDASIHVHPPKVKTMAANLIGSVNYAPKDYLERNKDIVNMCDVLIAAPSRPETQRSGTWSTVRYAKKINKPIVIL